MNESFTEEEIVSQLKQVNNSLMKIHSLGYHYRDLKIENLLIFENQIKLCDFGSISNIEIDFSLLDP